MVSLLESPKRAVRRETFGKFYTVHEAHANTLAASLSASVLQDVYVARARKYPSALEAALFDDKVPVAVYDNLIDTVRAHLDTVHRYLEVRRKALRLRRLYIYDCLVPLGGAGRTRVPYDKAVGYTCEAMHPLGTHYCRALEKGLGGRWVDRYENRGKRSGAFSAGGFAGPPYISMNYKPDTLNSVFTLAHEAGHSMHSYFSARSQPFQYYDYTIFVAEVASTFNEQLLAKHLLDRAKSKRMRAVLGSRSLRKSSTRSRNRESRSRLTASERSTAPCWKRTTDPALPSTKNSPLKGCAFRISIARSTFTNTPRGCRRLSRSPTMS
jgi:oligoendopeptidase F